VSGHAPTRAPGPVQGLAPVVDLDVGRVTVPATTVPALLARAQASDPGRPRLTWYGADGERVELSARVLANWVAKTANLLVEELLDPVPAGAPAVAVAVDLPVHWRSVVWGLAAWSVGARVVGGDEPAAVVVTDDPAGAPPTDPAGAPLVVVTLAALAFAGADVPPGALDYNAVVAGYGDQMPSGVTPLAVEPPAAEPPAAEASAVGAPAAEPPAAEAPAAQPMVTAPTVTAPRVLLEAAGSSSTDALRTVVAALAADGSVVLRGEGAPDAGHLAEVERVTVRAS
jgi:uncharacterized protein (TIGR03089 family)